MALQIDRSDLISIMALIISLGAFGVAIYEANIMSAQQRIMQEQQQASVWPHIEVDRRYKIDPEVARMELVIRNKGVGPALISNLQYYIGESIVPDMATAQMLISEILDDSDGVLTTINSFSGVLAPGEEMSVAQIIGTGSGKSKIATLLSKQWLQLCYCSVYGTCWQLSNDERNAGGCQELEL
ncbi:MAG: hypothetical protein AAFQ02_10555 [Bacteroidota bacterium]